MKTDELWRWIWEDDDLVDPLGDLLGSEAGRPAGLEPPPAITTEGVWDWLSSDEDLIDAELLDLDIEPSPAPEPNEPSASPSGTRGVPSGDASGSPVVPPPPPPPLTKPVGEPPPIAEASAAPSGTRGVPSGPASASSQPVVDPVLDAVVEIPPTVEEPPVPAIEEVHPVASPASTEVEARPGHEEPVVVPQRTVTLEPPAEPPEPLRPHAGAARWARFGAFVAVAAVIGAVAPKVLPAVLPGDDDRDGRGAAAPDQQVVAWTVRLDEAPDATFVAILAAGVKPPVIMAVPADVTINVPGQGLGTVGEAAAGGDVSLVGVALENLIGVRMDGSVDSTTAELQAAVDALGTIEVDDQPMAGAQVIQYLTAQDPGALPDERFLRWQDVLEGIRDGVAANPAAVTGFPEPLRPVLAAGSPEPMALYGLPVVDLGAGLLRPDEEGLGTLVEDLFVPHAGAEVRIVVLNGVGRPGVGEQVARILVPEGFRLMSTGNANTFGVKTTKIIALSEDDLAAAQRAREHLGVGEVLMAEPTGLADIQIVVGQDFVDAILGGA